MKRNAMNGGAQVLRNEADIVQASMGQVEMTIWLCVMAVMASGMLVFLAAVSN